MKKKITMDCEKSENITVGMASATCRVTRVFARGPATSSAVASETPWIDVRRRPAIERSDPSVSASASHAAASHFLDSPRAARQNRPTYAIEGGHGVRSPDPL